MVPVMKEGLDVTGAKIIRQSCDEGAPPHPHNIPLNLQHPPCTTASAGKARRATHWNRRRHLLNVFRVVPYALLARIREGIPPPLAVLRDQARQAAPEVHESRNTPTRQQGKAEGGQRMLLSAAVLCTVQPVCTCNMG